LKVTGSQLSVGQRIYQLNHNVHLAAVGKAALGMVQGAEASIGGHVVEGIASVPRNTIKKIPSGARIVTQFFEGATNNLPDEDACINAERIEAMARHLRDPNDLFIVLISGWS
uniref:Glycerate kinase (inferred by orthology to a human protein) n=1 Tax=Anisakis simplex TaxID=6269 RepID=A0A0M3JBP9_ANISI